MHTYMVNWSSYNESLVRRGEVILDLDVIDSWHSELKRMNNGKKGAQYDYPDSFVQLLGYMRVYFHLPYRQTEGVVRAHGSQKVPSIPDYSTISRRVNKLEIEISEHIGNDIVIALDSTGIKVANRGEWMRHKWHVKRGYLKIHVAVDIKKKKIVSLEVTSEEVHDSKMLKKIVDNASKNNVVKRVLADGTYDSKTNFQYLHDNGIKAAIKVRKNSNSKTMGCYPRKIVVIQQLKDFDKWKDSVSYGKRWIAETVFSSIKRMFGEYVSARKFPNMAKELILKASLYNMFTTMNI
jgi:DDE family transposase